MCVQAERLGRWSGWGCLPYKEHCHTVLGVRRGRALAVMTALEKGFGRKGEGLFYSRLAALQAELACVPWGGHSSVMGQR